MGVVPAQAVVAEHLDDTTLLDASPVTLDEHAS
jgi:hypothetical protein